MGDALAGVVWYIGARWGSVQMSAMQQVGWEAQRLGRWGKGTRKMADVAIRTMPAADTITCPRCGAENRADRLNCDVCRINLRFALENPEEIARLRQAHAGRALWAGGLEGRGATVTSASEGKPLLLPVLLLLGSFAFVFCLGEAVHELGHFLAHRAYGVEVGIKLDPFGGSRILHGSSAPHEIWGITSLAGPLFNLLVGLIVSASLWRLRRPALLPLVLWGPVALIQEGVTFSLGMLTPGGDAQLIVEWGVPAAVILSFGILFLASGVALVCGLLPLVGISPTDSFGRKFGVVAGGMVSFMVLRLLASAISSPAAVQENAAPLIFSLLLASIVVAIYRPLDSVLNRVPDGTPVPVTWPVAASSVALAVGMILFQIVFLN